MIVGEYYSLSRAQLEHMRLLSRWHEQQANPWKAKLRVAGVPTEFTPDANASAFNTAVAFLAHEVGAKAVPVAELKAKAKRHGISWTTCRRAKSHMGISTIERDGEHYWALSRSLAP